jgi:plasmid stabilization system protein ParE
MKVEYHPEALAEFRAAAVHYEKAQPGLGGRFIAAVESAVTRIAKTPDTWRVIEGDVRRYLTKVFPYAVLYSIESDYVLIVGVMHCHRQPGYWRNRTEQST